ncbi:MAG: adenosine deaminase [Acidimicrobiia bacterium]|nr:adenosine deaminase [Acidimicrobiia bacterium]MDH3397025.1 adenosine deaminase [Acidimicrobiia bacterium]
MQYIVFPKVLLHEHLDGGLRIETILELAAESHFTGLPTTDPDALAHWFDQSGSRSLEHYLESFRHTVGLMQTAAAVERVAYESVIDLAADGVIYAEIRFAPSKCITGGLSRRRVVEAALAGLRLGARETGLETGLILTAMRDESDSLAVARLTVEMEPMGVVGFDLAGPELGFPADDHLPACRYIREASMSLTIHAGEAAGPDSIWRALQRCGAHRIGHGINIVDDCVTEDGEIISLGRLASYVRDHQIPLEVCVTSNFHTGDFATPGDHPVGALHRAGFAVTLSTDNRLMSNTSMSDEFALVTENHGFTVRDLQQVTEAAMMAAFCSLPTKERLLTERIRPGYEMAGV